MGVIWQDGMTLIILIPALQKMMQNPFAISITVYTPYTISFSILAFLIFSLIHSAKQKNLRIGEEYGSAKLISPQTISKELADKNGNNNRILSQNIQISMNTRKTMLNNNVLYIGGSGAGKTLFGIKPNIMQMNGSIVVTDPKGDAAASAGHYLIAHGIQVKVFNLKEMDKSDGYNPFAYIHSETDVIKLITNLMKNTTPKGSSSNDPFWEKAESLFLQALFYYVWMEMPPGRKNFLSVLDLLAEAEVTKDEPSLLDRRFECLKRTHPLGEAHPAVRQYKKVMSGASTTIKSILISVHARLAFLENEQIKRILQKDELNLPELGTGKDNDEKTKTALFCIVPDSDKSYSFLVGMLYSQLMQELYHQADTRYKGRLPIHVTMYLDEFYNTPLPDSYLNFLSTMRSREISNVIVIQNIAQLKELFKDSWETVPGNCDCLVFLGGNEQGSHKYVSELLGKGTIDKRSNGETLGPRGSTSRNFDVLGRELLTPDEVRKLKNKKCIVLIRGFDPVVDNKFNTFKHPLFPQSGDGGGKWYIHDPKKKEAINIMTKESLEKLKAHKGEDVIVTTLKAEEFIAEDSNNESEDDSMPKAQPPLFPSTIQKRLAQYSFNEEQTKEVEMGITDGLSEGQILEYMNPNFSQAMMRQLRRSQARGK